MCRADETRLALVERDQLEAQGGDTVFSAVGCDPLVVGETEVNGVDVGFRLLFQQFRNFSGYQGEFQLVSHF